ncbi:MAG: hypothetical protein ACHP7N_08630 [Caulobacterales bacterium]
MTFGLPICVAVELAVVTPLLVAFNRYRWRWLNTWSGAAVGFSLGALPWLLFITPQPTPSPDQIPGSSTVCTRGHCATESWTQAGFGPAPLQDHPPAIWEVNGHWTLVGWAHVAHEAAMTGLVGLIAAIVFRSIAVRSVRRRTLD